jgi:hypothetical protein
MQEAAAGGNYDRQFHDYQRIDLWIAGSSWGSLLLLDSHSRDEQGDRRGLSSIYLNGL